MADFLIICGSIGYSLAEAIGEMYTGVLTLGDNHNPQSGGSGKIFHVDCTVLLRLSRGDTTAMLTRAIDQEIGIKRVHADRVMYESPQQMANHGAVFSRLQVSDMSVTNHLKHALVQLMSLCDPHDTEFHWHIVSSVIEPIGEGTHQYVADMIATLGIQTRAQTKISHYRIGSETYASRVVHDTGRALWALAEDYGAMWTQLARARVEAQIPCVTYCYFELPHYGVHGGATLAREKALQHAFRGLRAPEIQQVFARLTNNMVMGPKVLLLRSGSWSLPIMSDDLMADVTLGIAEQLEALLHGSRTNSNTDLVGQINKLFSHGREVAQAKLKITNTPSPRDIHKFFDAPIRAETSRFLMTEWRTSNVWQRMTAFAEAICSEHGMHEVSAALANAQYGLLEETGLSFASALDDDIGSARSVQMLRHAHVYRQQLELLMGESSTEGFVEQLSAAWDRMRGPQGVSRFFMDDKTKLGYVIQHAPEFLTTYCAVAQLIRLDTLAERLVHRAKDAFVEVYRSVRNTADANRISGHVRVVNIDTIVSGQKTVLQLLRERIRHGQNNYQSLLQMVGVLVEGLTRLGLCHPIGLPADASPDQIVNQLNRRVGIQGADWFNNQTPDTNQNYGYYDARVFPPLPEGVMARLGEANEAFGHFTAQQQPLYVTSLLPSDAMSISAFEICHAGSTIDDQYRALIGPLLLRYLAQQRDSQAGRMRAEDYTGSPVYVPSTIAENDIVLKQLEQLFCETLKDYVTVVRGE